MNYKIWTAKSASGVSIKTLEVYAIVFSVRLIGIRHNAYLPNDYTGEWFYHFAEILSLSLILAAIYGILKPLSSSYEAKYDLFGDLHIPSQFGIAYLVVPSIILAVLIHP